MKSTSIWSMWIYGRGVERPKLSFPLIGFDSRTAWVYTCDMKMKLINGMSVEVLGPAKSGSFPVKNPRTGETDYLQAYLFKKYAPTTKEIKAFLNIK